MRAIRNASNEVELIELIWSNIWKYPEFSREYKAKINSPKQHRIIKNPAITGKRITIPRIMIPKAIRHAQLIIISGKLWFKENAKSEKNPN
jgi:hypothetical protein